MTLSKVLVLAGTASAGIGDGRFPMLRALVDHEICESNFGALDVQNGVVDCNGSVCALSTCDEGYHKLKTESGQSKKAKCVSNKAGLKWNKQLLQCRTCAEMNPLADNDDFDVSCNFVNKAGFRLKKCSFQCKNGQKIQPANKKKMTNLMCKCLTTEADGQCHWRKGSTAFDMADEDDFENWYCSNSIEPPVTEPPVTDPPVTDPPVTDPPVTDPPVTEPPVTDPPVTDPPVTEPPVTEPPVTEPPVTEPPVTDPPVTDPPVTEPPVTEPPVTEPPVTEPPATEPPATEPVNPFRIPPHLKCSGTPAQVILLSKKQNTQFLICRK